MSSVTRIRHELPIGLDIVHVVAEFDAALVKAIDAAREAGLPQGLLVGLLHGHAHAETHKMVAK